MTKQTVRAMLASAVFLTAPTAALSNDLLEEAKDYFKPIPSVVPAVKNNAVTSDKIDLGKMLFFDPVFLRRHSFRAIPATIWAWAAMTIWKPRSDMVGKKDHAMRRPFECRIQHCPILGWAGRRPQGAGQRAGTGRVEMASTPARVEATLQSMPAYEVAFAKAFPGEDNAISFDNMAKAIEAFEATLITPYSRFDQFLEGNTKVMNGEEQAGLQLFMDKGCASCHAGVNIGGEGYYPFGVVEKTGGRCLASRGQGALCGNPNGRRGICFPRRTTSEYRTNGSLFPFRQGMGSGAGCRCHGLQPVG